MTADKVPATKGEERRAFVLLAVVLFPVLSVMVVGGYGFLVWMFQIVNGPRPAEDPIAMPADASPGLTRRSLLGLPEEGFGHISSLVVRAHPARLDAVVARIARIGVAEVAMTDPTGKIVVTLETRDEDEIVAAMNAMQRMTGVVSVALVFHQTDA